MVSYVVQLLSPWPAWPAELPSTGRHWDIAATLGTASSSSKTCSTACTQRRTSCATGPWEDGSSLRLGLARRVDHPVLHDTTVGPQNMWLLCWPVFACVVLLYMYVHHTWCWQDAVRDWRGSMSAMSSSVVAQAHNISYLKLPHTKMLPYAVCCFECTAPGDLCG